jgi:hypothetical protein
VPYPERAAQLMATFSLVMSALLCREEFDFYYTDSREISYWYCTCDKQERLTICLSYVNRYDLTRGVLTLVLAMEAVSCSAVLSVNTRVINNGHFGYEQLTEGKINCNNSFVKIGYEFKYVRIR